MESDRYDRATAETLVQMTGWPDATVIRDDGVFVVNEFRINSPIEQAFDWTPAYDMDWPDGPNPLTAPALPIPFTANDLAAFMLDGVGACIPEHLNAPIGYPLDEGVLGIFGKRERLVRNVVRDAYVLAAQAQRAVGEHDRKEHQRVYGMLIQLDDANAAANRQEGVFAEGITHAEAAERRARAKASVAALERRVLRAKVAMDAKWTAWRAAMVRTILAPKSLRAVMPRPQATEVTGESDDGWIQLAVNHAVAIIERQRKKDLYPNQVDIADEIARVFRKTGVVGIGGKPLSGAYIKRHALNGISSAKGKQLSTSIRRGK